MNCGVNLVFHRTAQSPMKTFSFSSVLITVKERATLSTWNTKKRVCVYFLLHRGQTICHVKRWNHCELTFSHSAQYSPGTHTSGCWGSKRTHNQIHTHTHILFSQLTGCPLAFPTSFFSFFLISAILPAGRVLVHASLHINALSVCVSAKLKWMDC